MTKENNPEHRFYDEGSPLEWDDAQWNLGDATDDAPVVIPENPVLSQRDKLIIASAIGLAAAATGAVIATRHAAGKKLKE